MRGIGGMTVARLIDADKRIEEIKKIYCNGCDNYGGAKCRAGEEDKHEQ